MPAYNTMNYIVLDLEWNQSAKGKYEENHRIPFEIIEIGAVKLDSEMNIVSEFCQVIRPQIYKELHFKTKELTHLNMDILSSGRTFKEVFTDFLQWCGDDFMICTWGAMDVTELQRNMKYYGFPLFKTPVFYYDIQKIFSIVYEDRKTRRSLEWAADYLNIEKDDTFHRALSDAYYTMKVMKLLDVKDITKNYSIDCYQKPKNKTEQIYVVYDTYSKFISREFENKTDVLKDRHINSTVCYQCGKKAKKKIRWFSDSSKTYYCLAHCNEHGWLKGKIRLRKSDDDKIYIIKTLKLTDDAGADSIKERQLEIRKKRREKRARD